MKNKQKGVILLAASLLCSVSGMAQNASDKIVVSSAEGNFLSMSGHCLRVFTSSE